VREDKLDLTRQRSGMPQQISRFVLGPHKVIASHVCPDKAEISSRRGLNAFTACTRSYRSPTPYSVPNTLTLRLQDHIQLPGLDDAIRSSTLLVPDHHGSMPSICLQ
jgi:hypothetical protein